MKKLASIFSKSIAARLMLVNMLICIMFILITWIVLLSFHDIENLLTQTVTQEFNGVINNAQAGRDMGRIVADTTLLENAFFGKDDLLKVRGKRLISKINALEASGINMRLKDGLIGYRQKLRQVLEQCAIVNALYHEIQGIQEKLATSMASLEEIIAKKMIARVLQGEDASVIEQLAVLVTGYQETLLRIDMRFSKLGLAHFKVPMTGLENHLCLQMDNLLLQLRTLSASEPEIAEWGRVIMTDVMKYKEALTEFHHVACELHVRLEKVYLAKEEILHLMREIDSSFSARTEAMRGSIRAIIGQSGKFITFLAGTVIIFLSILTVFFVLSNIRKPMTAILTGIEAFSSGDMDAEIRLGRRDEWSIIEKALNNMVSQRKQAAAEIDKLSKVVETTRQAVVITDLETDIIYVNRALLDIGGFDDEKELIGRSVLLFSDEQGAKRLREEILPELFAKGNWKGELNVRKKDGSFFYAEMICSLISDKTGQANYLVSIYSDITKRKKYEKEILRLATVVEQASQVITITDSDGKIEYVNPAFEKSTGYTCDKAVGQNTRILKIGEQDEKFYKELLDTITSGKTWHGILVNKRKDGTLYYERAAIFPVTDDKGRITNYASVKQDITNERLLEQQLLQAQKMEAVGTLAGGVAHDFNNLLTVINGTAEISLMKLDKATSQYNDMASILQAGRRAENLTRQLLAFSRKQIYKAEIIDINTVIRDMDKMLRRLIGEDIDINMVFGENLPRIKADKSQLEQIFMNLVINARDAVYAVSVPDHKNKIAIETGSVVWDQEYVSKHPGSCEGAHVYFAVSDNGIGMDMETQQRVFEPFFTTKDKFKGTGLGLSTVYGIVKQNQGCVYVYSERGHGTMFKIYWPVTEEAVAESAEIIKTRDLSGSESILIVEDDPTVCQFASEALMSLGYRVLKADNGGTALELIKSEEHQFDLIVTDLIMPGINGKELVEKVKKIIPDVKVLYVSGYSGNHIVHNGLLEKGVNFIPKPYTLKTLAGKVREVLENT